LLHSGLAAVIAWALKSYLQKVLSLLTLRIKGSIGLPASLNVLTTQRGERLLRLRYEVSIFQENLYYHLSSPNLNVGIFFHANYDQIFFKKI
jgi:hypothetical protein